MDQRTAQHIPAEIFRAYDIRGEIGSTLNAAIAHDIGLAIGSECLDQDCNEIVIARDGRLSGLELATALAAGIMHAGVNIVHIGAAPTPVLSNTPPIAAVYVLPVTTIDADQPK